MIKNKGFAIAVFAALLVGVCALASCSQGSGSNSNGSSASGSENREVTVGIVTDDAPFSYSDPNASDGVMGYDVDLAREICLRNGWNPKFVSLEPSACVEAVQSGKVDVLFTPLNNDDEPYLASGVVYYEEPLVLVGTAGSNIATTNDLAGKIVVAVEDSSVLKALEGQYSDLAATFTGGAPSEAADYESAFAQLDTGLADAVACDAVEADRLQVSLPGRYVTLDDDLVLAERVIVVSPEANSSLSKPIADAFASALTDGTAQVIAGNYYEDGVWNKIGAEESNN